MGDSTAPGDRRRQPGQPRARAGTSKAGDFNGDGSADILWQNDDGDVAVWEMNGTAWSAAPLGNPGPRWHAKGAGDFNGDGNADILWQKDDGTVAVWK